MKIYSFETLFLKNLYSIILIRAFVVTTVIVCFILRFADLESVFYQVGSCPP